MTSATTTTTTTKKDDNPNPTTASSSYNLQNIDAPFLSHTLASIASFLLNYVPIVNWLLVFKSNGFLLRSKILDGMAPIFSPLLPPSASSLEEARSCPKSETSFEKVLMNEKIFSKSSSSWQPATLHDYATSYQNKSCTPSDVVEALIQNYLTADEYHYFITIQQFDVLRNLAKESTVRWRNGKQISLLDGVPYAVKDNFHVKGLKTTCGTSYMGKDGVEQHSSEIVERCNSLGMIMIGKTNMHEIGVGTTGSNGYHRTPRNPYSLRNHTGGSSSGSAGAAAHGLVPLAVGGDGGGSVRLPAALCGMVGLKPTFGRISDGHGEALSPSVGHVGPITGTVADCAISYLLLSSLGDKQEESVDHNYRMVSNQKDLIAHCHNLDKIDDLSDITAGIYKPYLEDADPEIVKHVYLAIDRLKARGMKVEEIELTGLEEVRVAHLINILSDMKAYIGKVNYGKLQASSRIALAAGNSFTANDLHRANQIRSQLIHQLQDIFGNGVDLILTPTSGSLAPEIPLDANGREYDYLDGPLIGKIMRFSLFGNLSGIPGITVPVGYSESSYGTKLPVGLQIHAEWYREDLCLRVARAAEADLAREAPEKLFEPAVATT